jgi:ribonuclease PH
MSKISLPNLIVQKSVKKNCDASVYLECENVKILCYLNGPFFSVNNQINNNFNVILDVRIKIPSYIENSLVKNTNDYEINIENILKKHILIEKYPRTKIEIYFEIFEFNVNYLPFCLMAASLCLNYAGVEQKGLLTSCNLLMKNNKIEVNPILNENNNENSEINNENNKIECANFLLGYNIALNENILYIQEGECSEENLKRSLATSIKICECYHNFLITKI